MIGNSKPVTSNQNGIHNDLGLILDRMNPENYLRPISTHSKESMERIVKWVVSKSEFRSIILDMGCGIGLSSYHLACKFPNSLIIGIDKSISRLERNNSFKKEVPSNLLLERGDLLDLWYLLATDKEFPKEKVVKTWILYPNPWPKAKHIRRRWHGNAVAPYIFKMKGEIELRSNWKTYLDEFKFASERFGFQGEVQRFSFEKPITPFEKKYAHSGQELFRLVLNTEPQSL